MHGKVDPQGQQKLAGLQSMADRIQHVYGLVERFAAARDPKQAETMTMPLRRAFGRLKLDLNGAGLDTLAQLAAAMEIAARRGASHPTKSRILREGVGSLRFQIDMEQRKVLSDHAARATEAAEAEADEPDPEQAPGAGEDASGADGIRGPEHERQPDPNLPTDPAGEQPGDR